MSIVNTHTVLWAGLTNYMIYRIGVTFDIAHAYTLIVITDNQPAIKECIEVIMIVYQYVHCIPLRNELKKLCQKDSYM